MLREVSPDIFRLSGLLIRCASSRICPAVNPSVFGIVSWDGVAVSNSRSLRPNASSHAVTPPYVTERFLRLLLPSQVACRL